MADTMITIISGTNRKNSNTLKIARLATDFLEKNGTNTQLIDLEKMSGDIFSGDHYGNPPKDFKVYQDMILNSSGILNVVPEYNGSFPGVLKYFIDLLKFPESFRGIPSGFIGLAAGSFGAIRAVEHLEMVFQYREAHIFGLRSLFLHVHKKISEEGTEITDELTKELFENMLLGFKDFVYKIKPLNR